MNIETILSLILGSSTLLTAILYWRQSKRIKSAEAEKAEVDADNAQYVLYEQRIADLHKSLDTVNAQLDAAFKSKAKSEEVIDDKTAKIRELNDAIYKLQNQATEKAHELADIERERDHYKLWQCVREYGEGCEECIRRKPQQNPPLKYYPFVKIDDQDD